ncbi:IS3 family transposase, partial [Nocardiopsis synnemataformans]|uniref:IS3 family transposase n=1 Tax=Nocardiopsis synnemataformans TaxID=61305 RepID=UPI003EB8F1BB
MAAGLLQTPHHRTQNGPTAKEHSDADLAERSQGHHERSRGTYGAPRLRADLAELDGLRVGRNRIGRLMRAQGLVGVHRRTGRKGLTSQDRMAQSPPDLVGRDFTAMEPNQ